ncbi:MAG: hypothetical protein B0A82_01610 [Alkalinema sp. CACIAM 70d]|nr:MAG: hypothetical protein B0A82_01610 [Alkalinema sp. CACIAM 70d]
MVYSDFTLRKVKQAFDLTIVEKDSFLPEIQPIPPSDYLQETLRRNLTLALAVGTEKARSELLISPVLVELREILHRSVSIFSGTEFTVDEALGLNGVCDFLISRSEEQLIIEAPVVAIVEAKKEDINFGIGQCIAEMIAAQKFNDINGSTIQHVYGTVTTGNLWRFLKLQGQTVYVDLMDYPIAPVDRLLGILSYFATR